MIDRVLNKDVKGRVLGTAKDAVPLRPNGWILSMNAPINAEGGRAHLGMISSLSGGETR